MPSDMSERGLERLICTGLTGTSCELGARGARLPLRAYEAR
jgi:hypothetical protein